MKYDVVLKELNWDRSF